MRDTKARRAFVVAVATATAMMLQVGSGHSEPFIHYLKRQAKDALAEAWYFGQHSLGLNLNHPHWRTPNISWPVATPQSVGLSAKRLDAFRAVLEASHTKAFLVARDGRLAYEWYARDIGPNTQMGVAALAKAVLAGPLLVAAMTDGRISLQDRVAKYVPAWGDQPLKSRIRLIDLASHSSGLEDVDWGTEAADAALHGWKKRYVDNPNDRFRMALDIPPVNFEPGSRYSYCGLGFYPLAYVLTKSLAGTATPDVRSYYRARITGPLGIPESDYRLNYGGVAHDGGLDLYAIGSGAAFTARAVARIGQLYLDSGVANGRQVLGAPFVRKAMENVGVPPVTGADGKPAPSPGVAWWVNEPKVFASLPTDAVVGAGAYQQILLVVPSLHLVAVRLGGPLGDDHWGGKFWTQLEERFFRPLMATLETPKNRPDLISGTGPGPRRQANVAKRHGAAAPEAGAGSNTAQ